jgi:hypothetical protein
MFGIAWGIVSIVLMVTAGEGLRKGQEEQARTLGEDVMIVFHGRTSLQAGGARAGRAVHWEDPDVAAVQADAPDCTLPLMGPRSEDDILLSALAACSHTGPRNSRIYSTHAAQL